MGNSLGRSIESENPNNHAEGRRRPTLSALLTLKTENEQQSPPNLKRFSYADLKMATRNFRLDNMLGVVEFGNVFKGRIDEHSFAPAKPGTGMVIAVKMLNQYGFQGYRDWLADVNYLGMFYHPHLVKLIGYCFEDGRAFLVHEYMSKGSLENYLFDSGVYFPSLTWNHRLKVALSAAKGLAYLHNAKTKMLYGEFKTSNILLDSEFNAKICDFGLASNGPNGDTSYVPNKMKWTYGYAAPEYVVTGHSTPSGDVYSFGVVLLEMLSGRRALDKNRPKLKLVDWAKPYMAKKRKIQCVLDYHLEGQYRLDLAFKVASLMLKCLSVEPEFRPSMAEVVRELEQLNDLNNSLCI